jgi:hypothetical protein
VLEQNQRHVINSPKYHHHDYEISIMVKTYMVLAMLRHCHW